MATTARAILLVGGVALLAACGKESPSPVVVMTQDLGIGADLDAVFAATAADVPLRVDQLWAQKDRSDFAARVVGVADAIANHPPDLIGVQSVVRWSSRVPASAAPPDAIAVDYLDDLLAALSKRGFTYDPVAITTTVDFELTGASGNAYRLTDREVVLAWHGVATSAPAGGIFAAHRTISVGGTTTIDWLRGWVAVTAQKGGKTFRFVSAHLDEVDPSVQHDQATALAGQVEAGVPTLLAGGFGSDPADPVSPGHAPLLVGAAALTDPASALGGAFPTCCRDLLCVDPTASLNRRTDLVLATPPFQASWSIAANGNGWPMVNFHWASEHAGILAGVTLP